ncbi:hypothetical protein EHO60_04775 [Leptospira fletcheri]|uniref:Hydrolase n=1 Tax=Leptospira fletcheri TaxID=2484981 RepID=A0A4R9GHL3_9LEPT|nr:hypothetical protein [Leptospira fletcheri]TGK11616.1 hypothetical protein EHO60_04775 [Leptospira fletcheri]
MSPFWKNAILSIFLIPIFFILGWILSGTEISEEEFSRLDGKREIRVESSGYNRRAGNLVLVQLEFDPEYYSREDRFRSWLEKPLLLAKEKGWLDKTTLVIYPAEIGNYLFLLNQRKEVFRSENEIDAWNSSLWISRLSPFRAGVAAFSEEETRFKIAKKSEETYERIFSELSKLYGVHILAGTIALPGPKITEKGLEIHPGNWEERGFLFGPDGKIYGVSTPRKKVRSGSVFSELVAGSDSAQEEFWIASPPFAKVGVLFGNAIRVPETEDAVKKTFVSRWIVFGSKEGDGQIRDWFSKAGFESSGQVLFFGSIWKEAFSGTSFIKTRYGNLEPKESLKGPALLNLYL